MKKRGTIERFEDFEIHHKILLFIVVMCLAIILIRIGVQIYNPNPVLFGFEFHHFDYGLLLLFITTLFLLFGKKYELPYLVLAAISFGMILDDFVFIRSDLLKAGNQTLIYNSTLPATIILAMAIIFTVLIVNHFIKKCKGNPKKKK